MATKKERKELRRKPVDSEPLTGVPGATQIAQQLHQVSLKTIALRHLEYSEVERPKDFAPSERMRIDLSATAQVNSYDNGLTEFLLDATITPDPRAKPVTVRLRLAVVVQAPPAVSQQELLKWLTQYGAFVSYPYIREIVSDVTTRGIYGTLLLDPMPLQNLTAELTSQSVAPAD